MGYSQLHVTCLWIASEFTEIKNSDGGVGLVILIIEFGKVRGLSG
jgi:hypothetical protein